MRIKKYTLSLFIIFLLAIQLACSLLPSQSGNTDTAATLNALYTAAAQTVLAGAGANSFTATPGLPIPTATSNIAPTAGPIIITATSFSTLPPVPIVRCDAAQFVEDVTIKDGSVLERGVSFTKTWRLRNAGNCSWTTSYALVFVDGDSLSAPVAVALTGNVNPGQAVDLAVNLAAPNKDGHYRGYWKLRNASGVLFGIGNDATTAFWVDINVKGAAFVRYDFAANYCDAEWENNNKPLPCPGNEGDKKGYVMKLDAPKMENGARQNEPGLLTVPKNVTDGLIIGTFPPFVVQSGDHFRALVNCQYKANNCDVTFSLSYLLKGDIKLLGSWREINEGRFYAVDVDLSALDGKKVKFILTTLSNGSSADNEAIWVAPRIMRQGTRPTATPTATMTYTPKPPTATLTYTPKPPTVTLTSTPEPPTSTPATP
jgi:hypothetical protein